MSDESGAATEWAFATADDCFYLLPMKVVEELAVLHSVADCGTWGEVAELGDDVYQYVLQLAGYAGYEEYRAHLDITGAVPVPGAEALMAESYDPDAATPDADDEFDIGEIPAYNDGDFPPNACLLMTAHVPATIIEEFGRVYETVFNGEYTELDAERGAEILAKCAEMGLSVVPSETLGFIVMR